MSASHKELKNILANLIVNVLTLLITEIINISQSNYFDYKEKQHKSLIAKYFTQKNI